MIATKILSREEIRRFSKRNDWAALRVVGGTWLMIAAIFAGVAFWTNPLSILIALIFLAGRQLSLAVIMHDCGHGTLFTRWSWNSFSAKWLAAPFIFGDAKRYRIKHAKHHRLGGTHEDPDLQNYVNYAVARKSFYRKIGRDLTGRTGWKTLKLSAKVFGPRTVVHWIVGNAVFFGVLYFSGHGLLYLLWPATYLTTYMLVVRIRNAAEHGAVPNLLDPDPRRHTRTTLARWWERPVFAPNNVNYHLEHHILPSVPCYRLRQFHDHLQDKGLLEGAQICEGYWSVVRQLVLPPGVEKSQAGATT